MTRWQTLVASNQTIILFISGQVFFVLGLAIVWQSRRHSRLGLARSLGWLGGFGLLHGIHQWGDIFIPVQAQYLGQPWIDALLMLQAFLLALSFAFLFQFGTSTLAALPPQTRWIVAVPGGLLILWLVAFVWTSQVPRWSPARLVSYSDVWARYLIGIPGALAAALGLRRQAQHHVELREASRVVGNFRVASVALAVYALLGGLIVPPAPFFPANLLNNQVVLDTLGVPIQVLRSLAGLVLAVAVVRGLEIFEMEVDRRIEETEQAQILLTERERISRELHDGAIQTVYTAGLIAESVRHKMVEDHPLAPRMDQVISTLQHAIRDLRQFILELEPTPPTEDLLEGLRKLANDASLQSMVEVEVDVPDEPLERFSPARAAHVLAITNEALSNITRHAQARHAWIQARHEGGQLILTIADDGVGMGNGHAPGLGLRNMRDRARLLAGQLQVQPTEPRGTQVVLTIPWEDPR